MIEVLPQHSHVDKDNDDNDDDGDGNDDSNDYDNRWDMNATVILFLL